MPASADSLSQRTAESGDSLRPKEPSTYDIPRMFMASEEPRSAAFRRSERAAIESSPCSSMRARRSSESGLFVSEEGAGRREEGGAEKAGRERSQRRENSRERQRSKRRERRERREGRERRERNGRGLEGIMI